MQSQPASHTAPPTNSVAAIFNLDDPNEHRIFDAIQEFFSAAGRDRLHAIRRGTMSGPNGPVRMLWTLGSFRPLDKGTPPRWSVTYWHVDELAVLFQHCKDEAEARAAYKIATHPDARLPGLRMRKT
jgi:hypothetical protein